MFHLFIQGTDPKAKPTPAVVVTLSTTGTSATMGANGTKRGSADAKAKDAGKNKENPTEKKEGNKVIY